MLYIEQFIRGIRQAGGVNTNLAATFKKITTLYTPRRNGEQVEAVTGAKTLDEGDSGVIQRVTSSATITLPATVVGRVYVIENGGDASVTVTISPNASDKIMGNGFTSADDKDMINTLGNKGDMVKLVADGANGYHVSEIVGTWTREA